MTEPCGAACCHWHWQGVYEKVNENDTWFLDKLKSVRDDRAAEPAAEEADAEDGDGCDDDEWSD